MYFGTKSYLKSNNYHTAKHALNVAKCSITDDQICDRIVLEFKFKELERKQGVIFFYEDVLFLMINQGDKKFW